MKKSELAQDLLRTVPRPRLVAAIGSVLARRQRRAAQLPDDAMVSIDVNVEAFLATCSARQLRMLREIALSLEIEAEGRLQ
jgi:hypothetical protein